MNWRRVFERSMFSGMEDWVIIWVSRAGVITAHKLPSWSEQWSEAWGRWCQSPNDWYYWKIASSHAEGRCNMRDSVSRVRRPARNLELLLQGMSNLKEGVEYYFSVSCVRQDRFSSTKQKSRMREEIADSPGPYPTPRPGTPFGKTMLIALVWHQAAYLLLAFGTDSEIVRWRLERRFENSLILDKCSCFWKQQGETFRRCAFVTLQLRVNFLATISVFLQSAFLLLWLATGWSLLQGIFYHPHPLPAHPHISSCSASDRSRLHHILWHCERATEYFPRVFWCSVTSKRFNRPNCQHSDSVPPWRSGLTALFYLLIDK